MRNPIRRLSLGNARRVETAMMLSQPDVPSLLTQFLSASKEKYLRDIHSTPQKGSDWTVVMGNEAGDLDSVASSIGYAWILSEVFKKSAIPLLQLERDDLDLRAENMYALSLAGITQPKEQLLFLTDLAPFFLSAPTTAFPSHTFALVDHNSLGSAYTFRNPSAAVTAILDHHADEGKHLDASPRVIAPSGSCISHVTAILPPDIPNFLATLLLTGILIDTNGLKPGGKALELDHIAAGFLAPRSTLASLLPASLASHEDLHKATAIKDLTRQLNQLKTCVDHLSARDLLRRDYKEYVLDIPGAGSIRAGLASVPIRLREWELEDAAGAWMEEREIQVLGVLTSFRGGKKEKGKYKREMAWVVYDGRKKNEEGQMHFDVKALAEKLFRGLESSEELKVRLKKERYDMEKGGKLPDGALTRTYNQGNVNANRKVTAPLMKRILEAA